MHTVTLADAKSQLTQLIEQIASGVEKEIVISRDGKPVILDTQTLSSDGNI